MSSSPDTATTCSSGRGWLARAPSLIMAATSTLFAASLRNLTSPRAAQPCRRMQRSSAISVSLRNVAPQSGVHASVIVTSDAFTPSIVAAMAASMRRFVASSSSVSVMPDIMKEATKGVLISTVGDNDGDADGEMVGLTLGDPLGDVDGLADGETLGDALGLPDGEMLGL